MRTLIGGGNILAMVQGLLSPSEVGDISKDRDTYLAAYRVMLLTRLLDDKFASLYRMGKIHGGVFLGRGQEALSVSIGLSLRKGDVFAPLIRDLAGRLAFGEPLLDAVRTYLGSALGPMRGRDGNVHRGRPLEGLLPMISHLGAMISVVNGVLIGHRFNSRGGTVGVASIGEGGTSTGSFHEAINQAAVERLPLVVVVANNQYAYSTPNERQFACASLVQRAAGYGIQGVEVDGTDLGACLGTLHSAVENARKGSGPQLVVADLLRLCGHGEHDDAGYIDPALKKSAVGRDCLKAAESKMLSEGWASKAQLEQWRAQVLETIEQTVAKVQREPAPDPYREDWCPLAARHLSEGNKSAQASA